MDQPPLNTPQNFINRELSALEFNARVLAQAQDARVPLLERLRFLCICSSNLDEFFEIRVAGLKQLQELGSTATAPDALSVAEQLAAIHTRARQLIDDQYHVLNDVLLGALHDEGVELLAGTEWDAETRAWLERHFIAEVEPVLSPLGLDPARPFPRIQNKSLNFIVRLSGEDAFGRGLEPHGRAVAPMRQFAFERAAQVVDFFFIDEQVAVACQPELEETEHLHAGEQPRHAVLDDGGKRDITAARAVRDLQHARQ